MTLKKFIYITVAVIVTALLVSNMIQEGKIQRLKTENSRISNNNLQLMSDNRTQITLYLTEKEVTGKLKTERDSLANRLKIAPKQITKIVEVKTVVHDTIRKEVPVQAIGKDSWKISDKGECWSWSGVASLKNDSLHVQRQNFEYDNTTTPVYYRVRPHKFLFIKYGKWVNKVSVTSKCGRPEIHEFNFLK